MMLCTIILREEYQNDMYYNVHAPRLRPVVASSVEQAYEMLLELSEQYPHAKNAPTSAQLESMYDKYRRLRKPRVLR